MTTHVLQEAAYVLNEHYKHAEETEQIIINCAFAAAGADVVGSLIPGLSIPALIISCFGAVWVMYGKICQKLGITIRQNVLKVIARAALANVAANLGGSILAILGGLLIPGSSALVSAVVTFLSIYLAGLVFLRLLDNLACRSADPHTFSDLSQSEIEREAKRTKLSKDDLKAAVAAQKGAASRTEG